MLFHEIKFCSWAQQDLRLPVSKQNATVTLESGTITESHLEVRAKVPKLKAKDFPQYVEEAKANCPVSKALGAINVTMHAQLVKTFKVKPEAGQPE